MHHIHLIDRNLSTSSSANIPLQAYSAPQLAAGHRFPMVRLFPCAIMDHRQNVSVICAQARSTSGNQMALLRHGVRLQGVFRRIYETLLEDGLVTEKQVHNDHHTHLISPACYSLLDMCQIGVSTCRKLLPCRLLNAC